MSEDRGEGVMGLRLTFWEALGGVMAFSFVVGWLGGVFLCLWTAFTLGL